MHPSLDAADHQWRNMVIIPVSLNHHLMGMEIILPRASIARMQEILRVMRHRVLSQNATLTAPLGSICLRLVVVHGKAEASGNRDNDDKTVTTAVEVAPQWAAKGAAADTDDGRRRRSTVAADEVSGGRSN